MATGICHFQQPATALKRLTAEERQARIALASKQFLVLAKKCGEQGKYV